LKTVEEVVVPDVIHYAAQKRGSFLGVWPINALIGTDP
jgi:hypothetical protein